MTTWQHGREARNARVEAGAKHANGKIVEAHDATRLLEAVVRPGDRVCLEGDNQKQADLLSAALLAVLEGGVQLRLGRPEGARRVLLDENLLHRLLHGAIVACRERRAGSEKQNGKRQERGERNQRETPPPAMTHAATVPESET